MRVDIPDYGTFVDFPDDTAPELIERTLRQNFPPKQKEPLTVASLRAKFVEDQSANTDREKAAMVRGEDSLDDTRAGRFLKRLDTGDQFTPDVRNVMSTAGARVGAGFEQSAGGLMQAYGEENTNRLGADRAKLEQSRAGRLLNRMTDTETAQRQAIAQKGRDLAAEGRSISQVVNEEKPLQTRAGKIFGSAVESVGANLPGMTATVVTGSPAIGLSMMGAQSFGQSYDEARAKGLAIDDAIASAGIQGGTEVATELLPFVSLAKYLKTGNLSKEVLKYYLADIPSEHVATAIQKATGAAYSAPNMTQEQRLDAAADYLASPQHGQDQIDTFFTTLLQGAVIGGTAKAARSGSQWYQQLKGGTPPVLPKHEVRIPDTGVANPTVSVDDAIRAADAEIGGDWTHAQRSKLLKELGGEVEEATTELVAAPETVIPTAEIPAVEPVEMPVEQPVVQPESVDQPAEPSMIYGVGEQTATDNDVLQPLIWALGQDGRYNYFHADEIATGKATVGPLTPQEDLPSIEAAKRKLAVSPANAAIQPEPPNLPESQQNNDAQIPPVAGLSEPVDTQVSPEKREEGAVAQPEASTEPVPATVAPKVDETKQAEPVSRVRAAQLRAAAQESTDIKGGYTGWKVVQHDQGAMLVHPTKDEVIPFTSQSNKYADVLRAKAEAQAYAMDNPVSVTGEAAELDIKPMFSPSPKVEAPQEPVPVPAAVPISRTHNLKAEDADFATIKRIMAEGGAGGVITFNVDNGAKIEAERKAKYLHAKITYPSGKWKTFKENAKGTFEETGASDHRLAVPPELPAKVEAPAPVGEDSTEQEAIAAMREGRVFLSRDGKTFMLSEEGGGGYKPSGKLTKAPWDKSIRAKYPDFRALYEAAKEATPVGDTAANSEEMAAPAAEPWQIPLAQFRELQKKVRRPSANKGPLAGNFEFVMPDGSKRVYENINYNKEGAIRDFHRKEIQRAMQIGREIPADVLAEYPDLAPRKYSTSDTESRADLTLERVRSSFPTLPVTEDNGTFTVTTPSGIPIRISKVGEIEFGPEQRVAAEKEYGRKLRPDERPSAEFRPLDHGAIINLTERGVDQLDHEAFHASMNLALTERQKAAVIRTFGNEEKAAAEYQRLKESGALEGKRGNYWLSKIYRFLRALRQLISPTAKGVMEDVASGKVWGKAHAGDGGARYAAQGQTDTPAFKRWFGDSEVVDEDGKPLVVYHGTGEDINIFDPERTPTTDDGWLGAGIYLTASQFTAQVYAENTSRGAEHGKVMSLYAKVENPYISKKQAPTQGMTRDEVVKWTENIKAQGYDGIVFHADHWNDGIGVRFQEIVVFSPTQIKSATDNNGDFNPANPDIRYSLRSQQPQNLNAALDDLPPETKGQKFWRKMQDRYSRVQVIQDYLKEKGIQLSELANVSRGLSVMNGKVADQLQRFMDGKIAPLVEEAAKHKVSLADIEEFLLMQHAEEANEQMRKLHDDPDATAFGVTDQEAQQALADFRARADFAQLERIANKFRALSDDTANMLVREGIISQDMKDAWESAYQHYVPLRGGDEDTKQGTGKGLRVNGKQQRRSGHNRRDEHVIENIIKARERAVKAVEKNKVALSVAQLIKEVGDDRIGTIGKPEKRRVFRSKAVYTVMHKGEAIAHFDNIDKADKFIDMDVRDGGNRSDYVVNISSDPSVTWAASPTLGDSEINAYVNGHQVRIQINDEVAAKALTHGGIEELATIFKFGKMINNYLSRIYTGYDPRFTIRNTARDFTAGMINLTGDYGAKTAAKIALNYPTAVKELLKARKDPTNSQWIDRYRKAGGSTGASWLPSIERLGEKLEDAYHEQIGAIETYRQVYDKEIAAGSSAMKAGIKAGAASGVAKFKGIPVLGHYLRIIEAMNSVSENAFRVATFKTLVEEGKSDGEAGEAAKSSTINFDKRGELGNQIGALYLFFNPAVQGVRRTGKALFESEHKFQAQAMAGSMAFVGFMAAELARSMWDDDEWDKIPRSVKNRNLVLRASEKGQVTIPIPYDYGTFVGVGYALSDMAHGKADWRTGLNLAGTIMDAVSFAGNPITDKGEISVVPVVPTLMKMLLAPSVNVNNFGSEIYPDKAEWKPDSQNMYRNTKGTGYAKAAEKLNELTGGTKYTSGMVDVSPEVLKFYTRAVFGGAASFVMEVNDFTNVMANGEKPEIGEVPLANVVMRENTVRDTRAKFYEIASQAGKAAAAFNAAKRDRAFDIAAQLKDKDSELIAISRVASTQKKLAKAKRDALDAIRLDEDLSFAEKREKMRLIERQEEMIYDRLIRKFNQKD